MASYSIGRYTKSGGMGWIIASVNETIPSTKELVRSRMKSRVPEYHDTNHSSSHVFLNVCLIGGLMCLIRGCCR